MFEIGQQVVCIKDTWWLVEGITFKQLPIAGSVYTIRGFLPNSLFTNLETGLGLYFEEIYCSINLYNQECAWDSRCFRPVKKTDISIFTQMLKPIDKVKKKENELV